MLSGLTGHLPEIIIVLVVILIIWGPGKLPDVGAAMGKGIREFRKASSETHDAVMGTHHDEPRRPHNRLRWSRLSPHRCQHPRNRLPSR